MATLSSEKIFIDPKEEISFVIERVSSSEKDNIILVVPQNSILFTSTLSLKILYRQVIQSKKNLIIVTEDKYGTNISQKAGFIVVQKVSQITSDLWEVSKSKLTSKEDVLHNKKKELVDNLAVDSDDEVRVDTNDDTIAEEYEGEEIDKEKDFEEIKPKESLVKSKAMKAPEVKSIQGIELIIGGDIDEMDKDIEEQEEIDKRIKLERGTFSEKRFAGKDLTRARRSSGKGLFNRLFNNSRSRFQNNEDLPRPWYKTPLFIFVSTIIVGGLLITYLSAYQWNRVTIEIGFNKEEVDASVEIEARETLEDVDLQRYRVPISEIKNTESTSATGEATGEGSRGEIATGTIYIFNKSEEPVALVQGSRITITSTSNEYELVETATIPAASRSVDQSIIPGRVDGVVVKAVSHGEEYNQSSSSDPVITVEGYSGTDIIEAHMQSDFDGGTTDEFVSVSEEDVDKVKKEIEDDLEKNAIDGLSVPNGYILIEESIKAEISNEVVLPELGEEGDDGAFDLSIEIEATGLIVKESDLEVIISDSLADEESALNEIDKIENLTIINFVEGENSYFFTVESGGTVTKQLDEEEIKDIIKGKGLGAAEKDLEKVENLSEFELNYSPSFVPKFLKFVPNSSNKITVNFR